LPLNLYFSWHTGEAFTNNFEKLFSTANIFVVEYALKYRNVAYYEHLYNKLSKGRLTPKQFLKIMPPDLRTDPDFYRILSEIIFNNQKRIYLERSPMALEEALKWIEYVLRGTRDERLQTYENKLREQAMSQKQRDESFARQLKKYVSENPDTEILTMRGAMHQRALERFLTAEGVRFTSHPFHSPMPLTTQETIVASLEVGEATNPHELLLSIAEKRRIADPRTTKISELAAIQIALREVPEQNLLKYLDN